MIEGICYVIHYLGKNIEQPQFALVPTLRKAVTEPKKNRKHYGVH